MAASAPMQYRLRARILCHDVRLSDWIETVVTLDTAPTPEEAERLLWPAADALVAQNLCECCPYDLSEITITAEAG